MPHSSPRGNPFTLIELLVVVAIITVLASMLLPALSRARDKARDVACLNRHKQIIVAANMYSGDYDGWLPYNGDRGYYLYSKTLAGETGLGMLNSLGYVTDRRLLWCGSEGSNHQNSSTNKDEGLGDWTANPKNEVCTDILYRCGIYVQGHGDGTTSLTTDIPTQRFAMIASPADGVTACASSFTNRMQWYDLHQGRGTNVGMADGSAAWLPYAGWSPAVCTNSYDDRYRNDMNYVTIQNLAYRVKGLLPYHK